MEYQGLTAQLIDYKIDGGVTRTILKFDKVPSGPLAPSSIGILDEPNKTVLELHKVIHIKDNNVTFLTFENKTSLLEIGTKYSFRSYWAPWQLEIAQSDPEQWSKEYFETSDMLTFRSEDGSIIGKKIKAEEEISSNLIIPKGWDHEHCSLCWKAISAANTDEKCGYRNKYNWVCRECYEKYIKSGFGRKLGNLD